MAEDHSQLERDAAERPVELSGTTVASEIPVDHSGEIGTQADADLTSTIADSLEIPVDLSEPATEALETSVHHPLEDSADTRLEHLEHEEPVIGSHHEQAEDNQERAHEIEKADNPSGSQSEDHGSEPHNTEVEADDDVVVETHHEDPSLDKDDTLPLHFAEQPQIEASAEPTGQQTPKESDLSGINAGNSELLEVLEQLKQENYLLKQDLEAWKATSPVKSDRLSINTETAELVEDLERLERENFLLKQDIGMLKADFEFERLEMRSEIDSLQQENRKYLETIIKHSKANADNSLSKTSSVIENSSPQTRSIQRSVSSKSVRSLTLKQLKDVIEEIYLSKAKFDQRCIDNRQPRETLEQYMYSFLMQKYGLKNISMDWAAAILEGVQRYSQEDNDVAVFGKVLLNQCDEEFRNVQQQVKDTTAELLKLHLRGKFPLKHPGEIAELQAAKINGYLAEEEWLDIVKYMYNETDSELLISLLKELSSRKAYPSDPIPRKQRLTREDILLRRERERAVRGRIAYDDFMKVLLDFQLKGHEKFLAPYLKLFRSVDTDSNGVISEFEFRHLLDSMELKFAEDEVLRMLQIVDPFNNQHITFSESVSLFTSETVALDDEEALVTVLQALSSNAELN